MKKYILILTLLTGIFSMSFAQENQPVNDMAKQERIKALYVAYVTQQLALTPDEAQKFWPVHTQFENDLKGVKNELPELDKQQVRLDIKKRYQDNFNKIIGTNRCERFFRMDGEFKRKLMDRVQKQGNNPQRPNQRPNMRRGQ
jgi:Skp family chaperone for outer membrane proteins